MFVYTLEQSWEILRHYFENHGNVAECVRKLRTDFRRREAPSARFERCRVIVMLLKTVRTPENNASRAKNVPEAPSTSIHCRSQQLNISEALRLILHKRLRYKVQLVQELKPIDQPMRFR